VKGFSFEASPKRAGRRLPAGGLWILSRLFFIILFFTACASPQTPPVPTAIPFDLSAAFPQAGVVTGWDISQETGYYQRDNLFNLVDGQAESFFAYGFEQVAVQRYQNGKRRLNVEIWQLASPSDAYGLFTAGRSGQPAEIGVEGDADAGRRLAFWQDRFFTSLTSSTAIEDKDLMAFGRFVSAALPQGGQRPTIVDRLPITNRVERSEMFFHEETSIQMEVWLGGENLLGLSQAVNGVLARYNLSGQIVHLALIEYPTSGEAEKGLSALKSGKIAKVLTASTKGDLLGVVFGEGEAGQAESLMQDALK
jgi:hypothetical protein